MLREITFTNYRCFETHTIPIGAVTIAVGQNNAGKSTFVEGLRIVAIVCGRFKNLAFNPPPKWLDLNNAHRGVSPSAENLNINFQTIVHRYGEPPACITAIFTNNCKVVVYLHPEGAIYAILYDNRGRMVRTKAQARELSFPEVNILPQVAPVLREETILRDEYVLQNMSSTVAHRHFRNQLRLLVGEYRQFRLIARDTWPGLRIVELQGAHGQHGGDLALLIQDGDFVAELAWMGHGLQMWLQTIWFVARTPKDSCVILDEPDVYMHPDLQRRLIRLLRRRFPQVIMTTHSVEIMSEVKPDEVLIIDKCLASSAFAASLPAIQELIDRIGGVHNILLARLWSSKICLFLEGLDMEILGPIHRLLFPLSSNALEDYPTVIIEGWTGWSYALGSARFLSNAGGEAIKPYCILDRDYHLDDDIVTRYRQAHEMSVQLHIWKKKELENYLILPNVIERIIRANARADTVLPSIGDIEAEIDRIALSERDNIVDAISTELWAKERGKIAHANRKARDLLNQDWGTAAGRLSRISGKVLLRELSKWATAGWRVPFGIRHILDELRPEEVAVELREVLSAIQDSAIMPEMKVQHGIKH